jgi:hypothetical protein
MKVLIVGKFHSKNSEGYERIFNFLKYTVTTDINDIQNCNYIISPGHPIDTSKYPNKKFIFGPHFSIFPNNKLYQINNIHKNAVYIQPSTWPITFWQNYSYFNEFQKSKLSVPFKPFPFPVNTEKFKPIENNKKDKVFIYFKRRNPKELEFIKCELDKREVPYAIFDYVRRYDENHYLQYLQQAKYGIILDAHESQGFAIEEALSCNVPLLVWCAQTMNQEYGSRYEPIPCTSVPYWDERCGEIFYKQEECGPKFDEFISKLDTYKPREYVLENLSVEKCAENFKKLISYI